MAARPNGDKTPTCVRLNKVVGRKSRKTEEFDTAANVLKRSIDVGS
jgi:hypothetical protein